MARTTATELDRSGIDDFLENRSTGTLSLAKDDESYAVPISFTFSPETRDFYFRLGYGPDSRKREFIEATERATFVVADETEGGWTSVIARGTLEHRSTVDGLGVVPEGEDSVSQVEREREIPYYTVFDTPDELLFTLVRLETDEVTGIVSDDAG